MPANPVNATIETATVTLVGPGQIWLRGPDREIVRAWAPQHAGDQLAEETDVQLYLDADEQLNGWWDPQSGLAVNQRHYRGPRRPDRGTPMACRGGCGIVWQAPAADQLVAHDERCLTCRGRLQRIEV